MHRCLKFMIFLQISFSLNAYNPIGKNLYEGVVVVKEYLIYKGGLEKEGKTILKGVLESKILDVSLQENHRRINSSYSPVETKILNVHDVFLNYEIAIEDVHLFNGDHLNIKVYFDGINSWMILNSPFHMIQKEKLQVAHNHVYFTLKGKGRRENVKPVNNVEIGPIFSNGETFLRIFDYQYDPENLMESDLEIEIYRQRFLPFWYWKKVAKLNVPLDQDAMTQIKLDLGLPKGKKYSLRYRVRRHQGPRFLNEFSEEKWTDVFTH